MILGVPLRAVNFSHYKKKIPIDHQAGILKLLDYKPYDENVCQWIEKEIVRRVKHFADPKEVSIEILHWLHGQPIEIPSYYRLSELITRHYLTHEEKLIKMVDDKISSSNREKLNAI